MLTAYEQRLQRVQSPREIGKQRRREIFEFVCMYADELDGPTPSIREIAQNLGYDYKVAYYHVMKLIAHGRLEQERGKLRVIGSEWIKPNSAGT